MISQTAEYALRAVVCLASGPPEAQTAHDIAVTTKVPEGYLSKVLQSLVRAELVTSQRGIGGGFKLARPPEAITVLDVVNAVDPIQRIDSCPLGLVSHGVNLCALHRRLDDAMMAVEAAFRDSTIKEILDEPSESTPLKETPLNVVR